MKYIVLNTSLLDGIGDWVHFLEFSRFIRRYLDDHDLHDIQLAGFLVGQYKPRPTSFNGSNECVKLFSHFKYEHTIQWGAENMKDLWDDFFLQNKQSIICSVTVSTPTFELKTPESIPDLKFTEYGFVTDLEDKNALFVRMDMGVGMSEDDDQSFAMARGIRLHDGWHEFLAKSEPEVFFGRLNFFASLASKFKQFSLISSLLSMAIKRPFIPADLRDRGIVVSFVKMYSKLYNNKCDFYLPGSMLSSEGFREQIEKVVMKCDFITPESDFCLDEINPINIRIFSGFDSSDKEYKEMYLYSGQSGAGSAGDDTFSTVVSSFNLPLHHISSWQSYVSEGIAHYVAHMGLNCLSEYLNHLPRHNEETDWDKLYSLLSNDTLHQEWNKFCHFVAKHYNVYDWLQSVLDILIHDRDKVPVADTILKIKNLLESKDEELKPEALKQQGLMMSGASLQLSAHTPPILFASKSPAIEQKKHTYCGFEPGFLLDKEGVTFKEQRIGKYKL